MSFVEINSTYEAWLKSRCDVRQEDLDRKHDKKMSSDVFSFLRATFFRWAGEIEAICPELRKAPKVLSIGDMHLENFGTWRDGEGRLVWDVNDFDDAGHLVSRAAGGEPTGRLASAQCKAHSAVGRHDDL